MKTTTAFLASLLLLGAIAHVESNCVPTTIIMTRASGSSANYENGTWSTQYGLSSVNTASVRGSLYYVISETIDKETGYDDECTRKNGVQYIHFYTLTYCNTNEALWWFNLDRPAGFGGEPDGYDLKEFGQYVTFDSGACTGAADESNKFCKYLTGGATTPKLGPWIGYQDQSDGDRNPTDGSYWYSLPGECPLSEWGDKSDECIEEHPSGLCEEGVIPNGENCTWSYDLLGQVSLDDVTGITSILNNDTGLNFTSATEFCEAGFTEFERNSSSFDFVSGLDFWKDPLNRTANAERVEKLLAYYESQPNNTALPSEQSLRNENKRCFEAAPGCFDGSAEICTRDLEQLCKSPCSSVDPFTDCPAVPVNAADLAFPTLDAVIIPTLAPGATLPPGDPALDDDDITDDNNTGGGSSDAAKAKTSALITSFMTLVAATMLIVLM